MRTISLNNKILLSFSAIIAIFAVSVALLGYYVIKKDIVARAQRQLDSDLKVAGWVYDTEIDRIRLAFNLVGPSQNLEGLKKQIGLDYIDIVDRSEASEVKSEVVRQAFKGRPVTGTRIIGPEELKRLSPALFEKATIRIRSTPMARPTVKQAMESAMAAGYAKPILDATGVVRSVLYGGKIINRDFELVDKIRDAVFENKLYKGRPVGTVTIFLDDVRIATNVLDKEGQRAIGTRVSEKVYKKVVEEGQVWRDRAFVVTDWYLTAYEPIRNIEGQVIGILYVGLLERPFIDMENRIFLVFLLLVIGASLIAMVLSLVLSRAIARPSRQVLAGITTISRGNLDYRVNPHTGVTELDVLAKAFNHMAQELGDRQKGLQESHAQLGALNKSYLDLIGFVAHELKGILSSTIMSAYSVRDGYLGMVNFKQRRALDAIARNLDYFAATVKNFLNLSRIEKGEMALRPAALSLKEEIIDPAFDSFARQAEEKQMTFVSDVPAGLRLKADRDLLQIAMNNLVGNAVKYGRAAGQIIVSAVDGSGRLTISVYNDGTPIKAEDREKLFKKFSRVKAEGDDRVQGTGLGLFVTKEIIEKHGGEIALEVRESGNAFVVRLDKVLAANLE